jgi:hypothetical protein
LTNKVVQFLVNKAKIEYVPEDQMPAVNEGEHQHHEGCEHHDHEHKAEADAESNALEDEAKSKKSSQKSAQKS